MRDRVTILVKDYLLWDQIGQRMLVFCSDSLDRAEVVLGMLRYRVVVPFQVPLLR